MNSEVIIGIFLVILGVIFNLAAGVLGGLYGTLLSAGFDPTLLSVTMLLLGITAVLIGILTIILNYNSKK